MIIVDDATHSQKEDGVEGNGGSLRDGAFTLCHRGYQSEHLKTGCSIVRQP